MAEKDTTEKILEAYNDVFADIVNGFLFNGEEVVHEDELTDAQSFTSYKFDGKVRNQERDVSKIWQKGKVKIAFLGIENQSKVDSFMPLRVLSYDGAAYKSQLSAKNVKLEDLYPVVTLVLYFGIEKWDSHKSLFGSINIPENIKPFVNDYKINVCDVSRLNDEQISHFKSDFKAVADFFVKRAKNERWTGTEEELNHIHEVLDLLSAVTQDNVYRIQNEKIIQNSGQGGITMCDVAKRLMDEGREEGREQVLNEIRTGQSDVAKRLMDEGREEGREAEKKENRRQTLESVKNLYKNGVDLKMLEDNFHLTEEEVKIILA